MIELWPLTADRCAAILADGPDLPVTNLAETRDTVRDMAEAHVALYAATGAEPPWIGYLAIRSVDRHAVGICSFKDRVRDGAVEIAYFTFPAYEGHGIARCMATELIRIASSDTRVVTLRAHTLPEVSASTTILGRLGFARIGTVEDPEDGLVWRWERHNVWLDAQGASVLASSTNMTGTPSRIG